jgi:hypothetical protein
METRITIHNISDYRGTLEIGIDSLNVSIWDVFDENKYNLTDKCEMVSIDKIVSTKNQLKDKKFLEGQKQDPRQTAFELMKEASNGQRSKRAPISVIPIENGLYAVEDGNSTVQVLMLVGWKEVPVEIKS